MIIGPPPKFHATRDILSLDPQMNSVGLRCVNDESAS
jgi:hypothetical protein